MSLSSFDAFVGPAYSYKSLPIDCQECINFECLKVGSSASPYKNVLVSTAGLKHISFRIEGKGDAVSELPTNVAKVSRIRGLHRCSYTFANDVHDGFVVVGTDTVWRMDKPDSDLVANVYRIGTISEGSEQVSIIDMGYIGESTTQYVCIADGVTLYYIDMDSLTMGSLGNTAPERPTMLAVMGNHAYMCGNLLETGKRSQYVYYSDSYDPHSWQYTTCFQASTLSDPVKAIACVGSYLWVIGTDSYEIWQSSSTTGNYNSNTIPVRRVSGVASGVGTCSASSVATIASSVFFLGGGETGRSRVYEGSSTGSISVIDTDAMAEEISSYGIIDDAIGCTWADGGNLYYSITFPSEDVTWVYNVNSKNWHKRASQANSVQHRWKIDKTEGAFEMVIGGSIDSGMLYRISNDYNDEDGETIMRKRVAPHLRSNGKLLNHSSFTLDLECGNALPNGQGSDPQVMLRALDDGGRTPREPRWKSSGTMGMYRRRVKWYRLGSAVDRCYEVSVSDPIRWTIYGAEIETTSGIGGV